MVIGHALVLEENRKRWILLAQNYPELEVILVVPSYWNQKWFGNFKEFFPKEEKKENYSLIPVEVSNHSNWSKYRIKGLGKILKKLKPDFIFVMQEEFTYCLHWTIFNKLLFSPKSKLYFFSWQNLSININHPIKKFLWKIVCNFTDGFLAGTNQIKELFSQAGYRRPIFVQTEIGVDPVKFCPDLENGLKKRKSLNIGEDVFVIGFVGRLIKDKGLLDLAKALLDFNEQSTELKFNDTTNWKLLLVGDGELVPVIKNMFLTSGKEENLLMTGEIQVEDVPNLIRTMNCLVLPSRTTPLWKEQFGLVLAQAMMVGIPVIGSDSGAIPEVIGDKNFIFPEGDAYELRKLIIKVMEGKKPNLERIKFYSIDYLAQTTYKIIEQNS